MKAGAVLSLLPLLASFGFFKSSAAGPIARAASSSSTSPMVFAHYMLITRPPSNNYDTDMAAAKAMGIDAFAVNYGGQGSDYGKLNGWLTEFYASAQNNGMKAFLSIDTTSTPQLSGQEIANLTRTFVSHPAQLQVDGKPLLTAFELGPPTWFNWQTDVIDQVQPTPLFVGCSLSASAANTLTIDKSQGSAGSVTWLQPTLSADQMRQLDVDTAANKGDNVWIATVAPWFFKRLDANQNWAQAADDAIFVDRWQTLLQLSTRPDFIELTTWNDWGESSYLGPADLHGDCPQCYYDQLNHTGFQRLAKPYIAAFKGGPSSQVTVAPQEEEVFMFYRTQKADVNDNSGLPLPLNVSSERDNVYVVGMLNQPATVTVTTGPTTTTLSLGAGISKTSVPFQFGAQGVSASRNGQQIGSPKTGPNIDSTVDKVNDNIVMI